MYRATKKDHRGTTTALTLSLLPLLLPPLPPLISIPSHTFSLMQGLVRMTRKILKMEGAD